MIATIICSVLIAGYAGFLIYRFVKSAIKAKKSGQPIKCSGCSCGCSGHSCPGCKKQKAQITHINGVFGCCIIKARKYPFAKRYLLVS